MLLVTHVSIRVDEVVKLLKDFIHTTCIIRTTAGIKEVSNLFVKDARSVSVQPYN